MNKPRRIETPGGQRRADPGVAARISEVLAEFDTRKSAAESAGVSVEQLGRYEKGLNSPPFEVMARLAAARGISLDWLATGQAPKRVGAIQEEQAPIRAQAELGETYVLVPRYSVRAAAGYGAVIESEQIVEYLAFRADWVRERLRRNPKDLVVIEAAGDSNAPTINDGDVLLVDLSDRRLKDALLYVLQAGDTLIVKRVSRMSDGSVKLFGDNPGYEPEIVRGDRIPELRVVGRVLWAGGEV